MVDFDFGALAGALAEGGLNFLAADKQGDAQNKANAANLAFRQEGRDFARNSNVTNEFGDVTDISGIKLSPGSQKLSDTLRGAEQQQADIARTGFDQFSSGVDPQSGNPLALTLRNAELGPQRDATRSANLATGASNDAIEAIARRVGANNSGFNSEAARATGDIFDRFQLGGEEAGRVARNDEFDNFIKNSLGIAQSNFTTAANSAATTVPNAPSFAQSNAAFQSAAIPQAVADPTAGLPFASGAQTIGDLISQMQAQSQQDKDREFLIRLLGNQGTV